MKSLFKTIISLLLTFKAKQYLKNHRTQVIAITGSIGKTSTKEAIHHILKDHFNTYSSTKGFNTPLGVSLAILQEEESGFTSVKAWFGILKRTFFSKKKPFEKMVLEMGADQKGDIKKLVKIAQPRIGVITNVNPVHLDSGQFKNLEDIQKEKNELIRNMTEEAIAVLNYDDPLVKSMETPANKMSYGMGSDYDIYGSEVHLTSKHIRFKVTYKGETEIFKVPVLGKFQVYILLPAIAVGLKLGLDLKTCAESLKTFHLPPSRMNPLPGVNDSLIIDSSYNASPSSMTKALQLLAELNADRKIGALGTMNELGESSKEAHLTLGAQAAKTTDMLVAMGPEASTIKQGALEAGMPENKIYTFFDSEEAGHFLKNTLKPNDLILVKGSQNRVRGERLVKIIMKYPEKAKEQLCRQDNAWENI